VSSQASRVLRESDLERAWERETTWERGGTR
jgi:hypothetical protein